MSGFTTLEHNEINKLLILSNKKEFIGADFRYFTRNCSGSLSKDINTCSLGFINGDFPSDRIIALFEIILFSFELLLGILYVVSRSIITLSRMSNATCAVLEFSVQQN